MRTSFPYPRRSGRRAYRVGAHWLGDILDAMTAQWAVIQLELVPDLVINGLRDAYGARLGERLEPGGDIDAIPEDVVAIDDDVAEIDPDPQLEPAFRRHRVVYRPSRVASLWHSSGHRPRS